jgi:hypothetical protein
MNRLIATALGMLLLCACESNPMMTGEPQDWKGKSAEQLRTGMGEPQRVVPQPDGSEVWEYTSEGEFVREHRSPGKFKNVVRYQIRDGKVKKWFFERYENGEVVKRDH